ncbi:MAG: hypothetical protein BWY85_00550 [Firmicutes bacterium ADurb.Bin506]|nr:MAG: hypothetical protein BWY85_00550 [Firmicutes bacterium ADurb.Bin506]
MAYSRIRRRRLEAQEEGARAAYALALALICMVLVIGTAYARRIGDGEPLGLSALGDWIALQLATARGTVGIETGGEVTNLDLDMDGDGTLEAAVAVVDAGGKGRIELYKRGSSGSYQLLATVNSGPVTEMDLVVVKDGSREMWARLLVAKADYDQSVGAMTRASVITAYAWDATASDLVQVWQATTKSESVFDSSDQIVREAMQPALAKTAKGWVRLASASAYKFVEGSPARIQVSSAQEAHSYIEADDAFAPLSKRTVNQVFTWSPKWKCFILEEAEVGRSGAITYAYPGAPAGPSLSPGTKLAILEQERKCVEGLVFIPPYMARVLLSDGTRCFVRDDALLTASGGPLTMIGARG